MRQSGHDSPEIIIFSLFCQRHRYYYWNWIVQVLVLHDFGGWATGLQIRAIYWRKDQTLPAKLVPSFVCDMATRSSSRVLRVLPVPIVVDLFHEIMHQQVLQNVVTDRNSSLAACFYYSCTGFLGSDSGASHGFRQKRLNSYYLFLPNPCVISEQSVIPKSFQKKVAFVCKVQRFLWFLCYRFGHPMTYSMDFHILSDTCLDMFGIFGRRPIQRIVDVSLWHGRRRKRTEKGSLRNCFFTVGHSMDTTMIQVDQCIEI